MPLKKGTGSVAYNVKELTEQPIESAARKKAIRTLMKKHGISEKEARIRQALAISYEQARKK